MKLKEIRKSKGISQEQAAADLGISVRALQNYEYGQREPNVAMIVKLAQYYGVTTDYLLDLEPAPTPFADVNLSPEDEQEVFAKYMSLPDNVRAILLNVLVQLADATRARRAQLQSCPIIMTVKRHISKASAGSGYDLTDHDQWDRVKVIQTDEAERADFAVEVDGNSMLPEYHDGDLVLIVLAEDVEIGEIGLFRQNGKGYIKQKGPDRLISINPDYPDIYPEDGEIICVGRVIGLAELPE